jgi:RNA polymerase-binding transcription factor
MTKTEISKFQRILDARVIELTFSTRRRDAIVIEPSAEELERRLRASEREMAMRNLENESLKLREARAALRRIQDGSYGVCEECNEPISPRRLRAVPSAALCIRCQEAIDCRCGAKSARPMLAMAA